jgi:hypothetical protein
MVWPDHSAPKGASHLQVPNGAELHRPAQASASLHKPLECGLISSHLHILWITIEFIYNSTGYSKYTSVVLYNFVVADLQKTEEQVKRGDMKKGEGKDEGTAKAKGRGSLRVYKLDT